MRGGYWRHLRCPAVHPSVRVSFPEQIRIDVPFEVDFDLLLKWPHRLRRQRCQWVMVKNPDLLFLKSKKAILGQKKPILGHTVSLKI